jgi:hypothetical protein
MDTKGKVTTYLVIDSETDKESVCKFACVLGNADTLIDTVFCKELLYAFEDEVYSWPPTTHTLCTLTNQNKSLLNKCLSILISGRKNNFSNTKDERLVSSIGQDIFRAETNANGRWKLPNHILFLTLV